MEVQVNLVNQDDAANVTGYTEHRTGTVEISKDGEKKIRERGMPARHLKDVVYHNSAIEHQLHPAIAPGTDP